VTVRVRRVVAKTDIAAGRPITPEEIAVAETDEMAGPAPAGPFAEEIQDVAGKALRQALRAGQMIRRAWLEPAKVVHTGELVKVTVTSGSAQLNLDGVAEAPGAIGELIFVRNRDSQQRFRAKVEGKGLVSVKR
jgi:flagella basal body P-ring formation protein FlgA